MARLGRAFPAKPHLVKAVAASAVSFVAEIEAANATDAQSSLATFAASKVESVSAADTQNASVIFVASDAESASVADTSGRLLVQLAAEAETASGTDSFTRADANPAGGNWTTVSGFAGGVAVASNQLQAESVAECAAYYNAQTFPADQFCEFRIVTFTGNGLGPICRVSGTNDFYLLALIGSTQYEFYKYVGGGFTQIGGTGSHTFSVGDVVRLECSGNTLTALVNGAALSSVTDGSITGSGYVGLYDDYVSVNGVVDDFRAGALGDSNSSTLVALGVIVEAVNVVDTTAGICIQLASISEATSIADISNRLLTQLATQSETTAAVDAQSNIATFVAADVEAASTADIQSSIAIFAVNDAESVNLADTQSSIAIFAVNDAESVSSADTVAGNYVTFSVVVEGGAANDYTNAQTGATATESAIAVDSTSGSAIYVVGRAEAGNAADISDFVSGLFSDSVLENTSAANVIDATRVFAVSIAEAATASDLQNAQAWYVTSIAEVASILDTSAPILVAVASVAENVAANDSSDSATGSVIIASMTESASAIDSNDRLYIAEGSISEGTASAADISSTQALWQAFIAENGNAADDTSSGLELLGEVIEFIFPFDVQDRFGKIIPSTRNTLVVPSQNGIIEIDQNHTIVVLAATRSVEA